VSTKIVVWYQDNSSGVAHILYTMNRLLTQSRELYLPRHTVIRCQIDTSGVAHICQVQFVQPSLVGVCHITIFEHVRHILHRKTWYEHIQILDSSGKFDRLTSELVFYASMRLL
jgi:hypothetical protein